MSEHCRRLSFATRHVLWGTQHALAFESLVEVTLVVVRLRVSYCQRSRGSYELGRIIESLCQEDQEIQSFAPERYL